eukprot:4776-Heterococcus_DN1.PRE.2
MLLFDVEKSDSTYTEFCPVRSTVCCDDRLNPVLPGTIPSTEHSEPLTVRGKRADSVSLSVMVSNETRMSGESRVLSVETSVRTE